MQHRRGEDMCAVRCRAGGCHEGFRLDEVTAEGVSSSHYSTAMVSPCGVTGSHGVWLTCGAVHSNEANKQVPSGCGSECKTDRARAGRGGHTLAEVAQPGGAMHGIQRDERAASGQATWNGCHHRSGSVAEGRR